MIGGAADAGGGRTALENPIQGGPMKDSSCQHQTLVVGETCRVERCSHGRIHLVLGDMTLRVSESAFMATATALGVAARRLDAVAAEAPVATRLLC